MVGGEGKSIWYALLQNRGMHGVISVGCNSGDYATHGGMVVGCVQSLPQSEAIPPDELLQTHVYRERCRVGRSGREQQDAKGIAKW